MIRWGGVTAAAILLAGCGAGHDEEAAVEPRVEVETGVVERTALPERHELAGHLRAVPGGSALLTAPAAGVIAAVRGEVGRVVSRGQTVVDLETPELAAAARQLAAEADLAAREAARTDTLFQEGIVARKETERAQARLTSARAAASAAAAVAGRSTVVSPLGGTIQRILVQRGERVDAGQLLAEVIDAATLDLAASAPAEVMGRLRPGQPVIVAAGGDTITASITSVAPAVDSLTGVGEILIRFRNRGGRFRPGQSATAVVTAGPARPVLAVPAASIVVVGAATTVFVVGSDSVAHARPVTPGIRAAGLVAVTGDLAVGDQVVTVGAYGLADGAKVVPAGAKPE